MILVVGPPGMGKTELATEAAYQSLIRGWFQGAIWIDARTQEYTPSFGIRDVKDPVQSLDDFYDRIIRVLGKEGAGTRDKRTAAWEILGKGNYLLIIDNYETLPQDTSKAVSDVLLARSALPDTCKVIVTSKARRGVDDGRIVEVSGMNSEQALSFIRQIAEDKGVEDLLRMSDNELEGLRVATDGSPLAMELCIARVKRTSRPLVDVVDDLKEADQDVDLFLEFCYRKLYDEIGKESRSVCHTLALLPIPMDRLTLYNITNLAPSVADDSITELVDISLIKGPKPNDLSLVQIEWQMME